MKNKFILGLGSNIGDPLSNLREAVRRFRQSDALTVTAVSSIYCSEALLPENAPSDWQKSYLNIAVICDTDLVPDALLNVTQAIEKSMGRIEGEKWAPRIIDIDLLAMGELSCCTKSLTVPHKELFNRPFALLPLLELRPHWRHPDSLSNFPVWVSNKALSPFNTHRIAQRIDGPQLMGVINVTPNSFSDGGEFYDPDKAIVHMKKLFLDGAEILDLGGESTRPDGVSTPQEEEWRRLLPVLERLQEIQTDLPFSFKLSIDTRYAKTVEKAFKFDVDWINDVTGEACSDIISLMKGTKKRYVTMHNLGAPVCEKRMLPPEVDPVEVAYQWGQEKMSSLISQGLSRKQIIFDPGIGFGKTAMQSWQLVKNAKKFKSLDVPILFGHSRKSFLKLISDQSPKDRDFMTAFISTLLADQGVDFLRVNNVMATNEALKAQDFFK